MLRLLSSFWVRRGDRLKVPGKTRVLVITFNRTLKGYIEGLAEKQLQHRGSIDLTVSTFGKWAKEILPSTRPIMDQRRGRKITDLSRDIPLPGEFVIDEIDYLLGRFPVDQISKYLACTRVGRGTSPRVDRNLRQRILDEVVCPYIQWKSDQGVCDWNDLASELLDQDVYTPYDVVLADEVQDLSANQVRAIMHFAANPSSIVFVLDAAQRIYPRGFSWTEAGVSVTRSHRLSVNHRNTKQICRFALPLLDGLEVGDDGTFEVDPKIRTGG